MSQEKTTLEKITSPLTETPQGDFDGWNENKKASIVEQLSCLDEVKTAYLDGAMVYVLNDEQYNTCLDARNTLAGSG